MKELTQERLKEVLDYDPDTGAFTWKVRTSNRVKVGQVAGVLNSLGYRVVRIDTKLYSAHRLAFLHVTGKWPAENVDHINGDRADNPWKNLREASHSENAQNSRSPSTNTSGYKGVSKRRKKWVAQICLGGVGTRLGTFDTPEEAANAYDKAAQQLHGEYARTNNRPRRN